MLESLLLPFLFVKSINIYTSNLYRIVEVAPSLEVLHTKDGRRSLLEEVM